MGLLIHTRRQWFRRLTAAILVVFLFVLSGPVQTQPGAPDPIPRFNETFFPSLASATPAGIADGFGASPRTYRAGEFTFTPNHGPDGPWAHGTVGVDVDAAKIDGLRAALPADAIRKASRKASA